jgi:hypothetical protein
MPLAIILAASVECKERALADGFKEQTVLIKHVGGFPKEEKWKAEKAVRDLKPFQFAVFDFWGMGPD